MCTKNQYISQLMADSYTAIFMLTLGFLPILRKKKNTPANGEKHGIGVFWCANDEGT